MWRELRKARVGLTGAIDPEDRRARLGRAALHPGARYLVVEPGGFATDWAGASMRIPDVAPEYDQTVGAVVRMLSGPAAAGDPKRAGEILVRVVKQQNLPSHLILGAGAVQMAFARGRFRSPPA